MNTHPKSDYSRRHFLRTASTICGAATLAGVGRGWAAGAGENLKVDVCIYGGTSGGVIAAVALGKLGRSVALVEPTRHLGGMTSGGIGWIDIAHGGIKAFGGLTGDYYRRIREHYKKEGVDVGKIGNGGAVAEPHVAEKYLEEMLKEQAAHIMVLRETRLSAVRKEGRRLRSVTLDKAPVDKRGAPAPTPLEASYCTIEAAAFIDCSYEGDLLAAAGISHRADREGREEFNEPSAGILVSEKMLLIDAYVKPGDSASGLIPLVSPAAIAPQGSKSAAIQAFNFRLCLVKENPIPIEPPADYSPARFEVLARYLEALVAAGQGIEAANMHKSPEKLLKFSPLPHGRTDVNNSGFVSMDFVTGGAEKYAAGGWAERSRLWKAHEDYQRGVYHFLRTSERVAASIRADLKLWGFSREEFTDTGGWPTQLYVRECRRMVGPYVMKQSECENPPATMDDSIAIGTYSLDSHSCQRLVRDGKVVQEGGFMVRIKGAYPIPYRVLTPKVEECENLLATFCVSATHVCFASIRMEPPFMVMSESAAFAIHAALQKGGSVQSIDVAKLGPALREAGQILMPAEVPKS
jgi:hypothetical protein